MYSIDSWTNCDSLVTEKQYIPYVKQETHGQYSYIEEYYLYVILEVTTVKWDLKQFE